MCVKMNKCIQQTDLHICSAKEYANKKDSMVDMFKELNHKQGSQVKNTI